MKCKIYSSAKKYGAYLYIPANNNLEDMPSELYTMLAPLEIVMELDLSTTKKLANANIDNVKSHLLTTGYYLQLPPAIV